MRFDPETGRVEEGAPAEEDGAALGAEMLVRGVDLVASGTAEFTPQDPAGVTLSKMFTKERGRIRWGDSVKEIHNLVRAAVPWPVAHCLYEGQVCRVHRATVAEGVCRT